MRQTIINILTEYKIDFSRKSNTKKLISKLRNSSQVNWYRISEEIELSEEFIEEFQDKVYWVYISILQKLSEDFVRRLKKRVNWLCLANRGWSEEFKKEFSSKLSIED